MKIVSILISLNLLLLVCGQTFDLQLIGDYVSDDAASTRDYCESKYCLQDGEILFAAASQTVQLSHVWTSKSLH